MNTIESSSPMVKQRKIYPNGLTVIYQYSSISPVVTLSLFLKVSCFSEPQNLRGLTYLTQTLLSKGTKTKSAVQIAETIESVGGILNTSTEEDFAQIYCTVITDHFRLAGDLLYEIVTEPVFPDSEIEKEREIILANLQMRQEEIFNVAYDRFSLTMYGEHPYALPTLGTKETVTRITKKDIGKFHQENYHPENMILVIEGNINQKDVEDWVQTTFARLSSSVKSMIEQVDYALPELSKTVEVNHKFKQAFLIHGYLVNSSTATDYPTLKVINSILGAGMNSRLWKHLRDEMGLAYAIGSFYPTRKDKSRFVIYLGLAEEKVKEAELQIQNHLTELKTKLVPETELAETKSFLRGNYMLDHATSHRRAWYLGWWEVLDKGYEYDDTYITELDKVTTSDIINVANKYFTDNSVTVILYPQK